LTEAARLTGKDGGGRLAVSLGAPFWFDLLNRLVDLRGAGRRPDPTAEPAPAK
jgi:hypothetical protein